MRLLRSILMPAGTALVLFLAGCGSGGGGADEQSQVREVAQSYLDAAKSGDPAELCRVAGLSPDCGDFERPPAVDEATWQRMKAQAAAQASGVRIGKVEVNGDEATVSFEGGRLGSSQQLKLERRDNRWQPSFTVYDQIK